MTLFLRWSLLNVLALMGAAALATQYGHLVTGQARLFVVAILVVFTAASLYAGRLSWRLDHRHQHGILRGISHVEFAADICQYLGLIGAATGFMVALSGDDLGSVQQRVTGASIGLAATAVGVAASVVLLTEAHLLRRT